MNGSVFSKARSINGVGFKILAPPPPFLRVDPSVCEKTNRKLQRLPPLSKSGKSTPMFNIFTSCLLHFVIFNGINHSCQ